MGKFTALEPQRDKDGNVTIQVPKVKLRHVFLDCLDRVKAGCGEDPTPEETVWLYELCKEEILPKAEQPPSFMVPPVTLGLGTKYEVTFYEPTVEALAWLDAYASKWWESGYGDLAPALYAYANSGPGAPDDAFIRLTNKQTAVDLVGRWYRSLKHPRSLLLWAYHEVTDYPAYGTETLELSGASYSRDNTDPMDWGEMVATISVVYNVEPCKIMRMNESMALKMWENTDRAPAFAAMSSSVRRSVGGKAYLAMNAAVRLIISRHLNHEEVSNG